MLNIIYVLLISVKRCINLLHSSATHHYHDNGVWRIIYDTIFEACQVLWLPIKYGYISYHTRTSNTPLFKHHVQAHIHIHSIIVSPMFLGTINFVKPFLSQPSQPVSSEVVDPKHPRPT